MELCIVSCDSNRSQVNLKCRRCNKTVIEVWVKTADGDLVTKPVNYKTVGEAISHEESLGNEVFVFMTDKIKRQE